MILDSARELGIQLSETEEFKNMLLFRAELESNETICSVLREFQEKQAELNLSELLRQTAALYRPILVRAGTDLIVEIEDGLRVYGRAEELTNVIFNLLQNAKDYTERGAVSMVAKKENGSVIITVADTGTGVDPSILPNIFQRGVKGLKSSGMGIGLAICKEIMDRHSGEIQIENREAGGALITLALPSYEGGTADEL